MRLWKLWRLQLFADGGGDGGAASGGEGAADSGVTPADAGQGQTETIRDRLRAMGVPEESLKNRAYDAPAANGTPKAQQGQTADAAPTAEQGKKQSLKEILKADPDLNAEAERMVSRRVAKFKGSSEAMEAMAPALEMMARHYGMDPAQMDYAALSKAMLDDDSYYQQRAVDMGVSVDVAKQLDRAEALEAARQRDMEMNEQQQRVRQHLADLYEQGNALKAKYPGFDLDTELENDTFARLTAPGVGLSVEDAYFAVHREDMLSAARQTSMQNISRSIQAGQIRPNETGTKRAGDAPQRDMNSIRHMSKERMEELASRARSGETITPEMLYG